MAFKRQTNSFFPAIHYLLEKSGQLTLAKVKNTSCFTEGKGK